MKTSKILFIIILITFYLMANGNRMILLEGGTFTMGDIWGNGQSDEIPHQVTVNSFYISKYEITHQQYIKFLNNANIDKKAYFNGNQLVDMDDKYCPIKFKDSTFIFSSNYFAPDEDCPIIEVTWYGAVAYCNWKSKQKNLTPCYIIKEREVECDWSANGYRLPTEAEWEYAARSGGQKDQKWSGTNQREKIEKYAWYNSNSEFRPHKIGQKKPNPAGLYDITGNVWEWCWDWYGQYSKSSQANPRGPSLGQKRIIRGGGWHSGPYNIRNSYRCYPQHPIESGNDIGFRVVRAVFE